MACCLAGGMTTGDSAHVAAGPMMTVGVGHELVLRQMPEPAGGRPRADVSGRPPSVSPACHSELSRSQTETRPPSPGSTPWTIVSPRRTPRIVGLAVAIGVLQREDVVGGLGVA